MYKKSIAFGLFSREQFVVTKIRFNNDKKRRSTALDTVRRLTDNKRRKSNIPRTSSEPVLDEDFDLIDENNSRAEKRKSRLIT